MEKIKSTVCFHVVRSRQGEIIGSKRIVYEINDREDGIECVTRGILQLADGRALIDKIIRKSFHKNKACTEINLLTGAVC